MASPAFPEPPSAISATSIADCDAAVAQLVSQKDAWLEVGVDARIALLEACLKTTLAAGPAWVAEACKAKGNHGIKIFCCVFFISTIYGFINQGVNCG